MKNNNGNESDIDKLIRELQLEEVKHEDVKTDDVELEFDEIVYVEGENEPDQSGNGNNNPKNKFDKVMNILLIVGGAIIIILIVLTIIGASGLGTVENTSTESEGETVYVDDETSTVDIDRITDLDKATSSAKETTQEQTEEVTTVENTENIIDTELQNAKASAIYSLNTYAGNFNQSDYSTENWIKLQSALSNGIQSINAATTTDDVTSKLNNAKNAINSIETIVIEEPEESGSTLPAQ